MCVCYRATVLLTIRGAMCDSAVLLLDDNAVQAATRQMILRRAGYQVIAAFSAELALASFRERDFSEPIGLVITDHLMPGMNGAAFARELRSLEPTLPILVISGLDEAEIEYEGLDVLFRLKPLAPEVLLATVDTLLAARKAS